jgi:hypothetical protein
MWKRFGTPQFCLSTVVAFLCLVVATNLSSTQNPCTTGVCVKTWQNDNYRTGDNLSEDTDRRDEENPHAVSPENRPT